MKSISDVVGASGLAGYAEIALIIFFAVFMVVLIRVLFSRGRSWERAARLPLDDEGGHGKERTDPSLRSG